MSATTVRVTVGAVLLLGGAACAPQGNLVCTAGPGRSLQLPELDESSGVAWSRHDPAVFWTVNDGGDGVLFAMDTAGAPVARVETDGPRMRDVEDLTTGPCGSEHCLYLADTGDNDERRDVVAVHRLVEPDLDDGARAERTRFPLTYPDGPRDVEAAFIVGNGDLYLLSKGRSAPPTLYRHPGPWVPDSVVTVERIQTLGPSAPGPAHQVTGASWVRGTDLVLVRTYSRLVAYRMEQGRLVPVPDGELALGPLQQPQGEAVAADGLDRVILTSEAGPFRQLGGFHLLRCEPVGAGTSPG